MIRRYGLEVNFLVSADFGRELSLPTFSWSEYMSFLSLQVVADLTGRHVLGRLAVCGEFDPEVGPAHTFLRKSLHQCLYVLKIQFKLKSPALF